MDVDLATCNTYRNVQDSSGTLRCQVQEYNTTNQENRNV